ncbi:MAG: M20 family metallopeptidase [Halioglobus sp.]
MGRKQAKVKRMVCRAVKLVSRIVLILAMAAGVAPVQGDEIAAQEVELSAAEARLVARIGERRAAMLAELKRYVEINTGSGNIAGIDRFRAILAAELQQLGFATREYAAEPMAVLSCDGGQVRFANHLLGTRRGSRPNRILLNGHMDTVFPPGDEFQTLSVEHDGTLHGPGVLDMKGGIVVMLAALRALHAEGRLDDANITVFFNSDEEIGSLSSRPLVEELAKGHDVGLVFEGTQNNRMIRARKGLGQVRLRVTGRESHAGAAHQEGVSANLELAHKVVAIEALTDYDRNITVNVGVMSGGEKRNTVPGCAEALVDLRYPTAAEGEYLRASIEAIAARKETGNPAFPDLPRIELWSALHRPVKPPHPRVDALIAEAMGLSRLIGEPVEGSLFSGGGTDGSIAQAAGLPTLDTLGLDGSGGHSSRERASLQSLVARARLAAVMIGRQIEAEE